MSVWNPRNNCQSWVSLQLFVRSSEKAAEVTAMGFEAAIGDVSEIETIKGALVNADRVFLLTPASPDDGSIKSTLFDMAVRANPNCHIGLISASIARRSSSIVHLAESRSFLKGKPH